MITVTVISCDNNTVQIKNEKKGTLKASMTLTLFGEKKFLLDSNTAPKPQYTQVYQDFNDTRYFSLLNTYSNSIYLYNYDTMEFEKKIEYPKKGADGMLKPLGYIIKSLDSIYIYEQQQMELILANGKGKVLNRTSLLGGHDIRNPIWTTSIPQFFPQTVNPFIETSDELLLSGQYMFTIPEEVVPNLKFMLHFNLKSNEFHFTHTYPEELYGFGYNWNNDLLTQIFSELHHHGDKTVYSFPVSHNLYISDLKVKKKYQKVYGGSNFASTITSIESKSKRPPREKLILHYLKNDEYGAIKYDKFRKVYYRFIRKAIPDATLQTQLKEKPIAVIILDENFKYLGETVLGTEKEWHWPNTFVTEEGLNIEYLDKDEGLEELSLTLKIFNIKDL